MAHRLGITESENQQAEDGRYTEQYILDDSGVEIKPFSVDMQEEGYNCLDNVDKDKQHRADDVLVDEEGDEDGIGQVFTESQGNIQVIFGLISHARDLEVVEIVVAVSEVLNIHCEVPAIRVNSHDYRPNNRYYECQDTDNQVDCLPAFA